MFGGFKFSLYLCIVNQEEKSTLPREGFYLSTGETIKAIEWGADGSPKLIRKMEAEDGRGQTKREDVRRHNEPKNLDMKHR
jgi:hypothetical protein